MRTTTTEAGCNTARVASCGSNRSKQLGYQREGRMSKTILCMMMMMMRRRRRRRTRRRMRRSGDHKKTSNYNIALTTRKHAAIT